MAASDKQRLLLPDCLYRSRGAVAALAEVAAGCTPSLCGGRSRSTLGLGRVHDDVLRQFRRGTCFDERVDRIGKSTEREAGWSKFIIPGASETRQIPLYTGEFYAYCAVGGLLSCGITHTGVTPLDIVKCNMQIDPGKYKSIAGGFKMIMAEQGIKGLYKGWGPTVVGYSLQGACKFGLYEFFKHTYAEMAGEPFATDHKSLVFLAGSASAEFVADIALCPFEAVKAVSDLGMVALFTRGLPLRIFMIGTLTGAQWGIYDAFKVYVGLPTTGGAAPAHGGGGHGGKQPC